MLGQGVVGGMICYYEIQINTYDLYMYDIYATGGTECVIVKRKKKTKRVRERKKLVCASSSALWMPSACLPW